MKKIDEDIRTGSFCQVYLLYGEENYLKKQYRNKLRNALIGEDAGALQTGDSMNYNAFEGRDIDPHALIDLAETLPFFADRRVILVESSGFFRSACEPLAEYLPQCAPTTHFLFVEDEVDKRSKMYKAVQKAGCVVEFSKQKEELLTRWILTRLKKEGKKITPSVMTLFLDKTGTDMGNIDRELEKLLSYTMDKDVIEAADVQAIVTEQTTNRIFEMVNAIAEHRQKKALNLYYDLLNVREEPLDILSLIIRQFRILLSIRDMMGKGIDQKTMAAKAGIPEFAVKRNMGQAKGFSMEKIREALSEGAELEEAVKTGRMADRMAVEIFLLRYSC